MAIAANLSQENATLWIIANQLFGEMARYQPPFGFAALSWINSLFLEKKSLIRIWKFPVPLRREFGCKLLDLRVD
jgi:hypothetical protein